MIVADRKLLLISLPVCAGHIVCRCNLQAYLLQTFCIKPMFCKSVSVPNMSMFVHKRDQSKNVALKPKYRSKRLLMGSWFIFNWFSCPSEGWLAICNIYIYPGPTWGIWSDRQLLILSSERVAGDGLEWREATNWKLCGKNKPGLTVGLMLWLTWKRKTRDKRRPPEIANNKILKTNIRRMSGGLCLWGFWWVYDIVWNCWCYRWWSTLRLAGW